MSSDTSENAETQYEAGDRLADLLLTEKPVQKWRDEYNSKVLSSKDFVEYFKRVSPFLFNLESARNDADLGKNLFNEYGAKKAIIDQLEEFICGDDDPQKVLNKLKCDENQPTVCGRVFKNGEPTYACKDCGMDPTCVLCVGCFKQSTHRYHKYKMCTSSGGGCCDCGDPEAWKKDAYCDQHKLGLDKEEDSDLITDEMKEILKMVLTAVLSYSAYALEIDSSATIVTPTAEDVYCTILYNDETHVLEQVIQNLIKTIKCSHKDAVDYVTRIDREGQAVVKCSSFDVCHKLKLEIEKQSVRVVVQSKMQPLRVAILHKNAIAYQQFAIQLLGWLQEFLMNNKVFRAVFSDVITSPENCDFNVRHILMNDHKLWKTARTSWHRLLISGMLMEYENKKKLATIFTQSYATIMQDYIRDDHDHTYSIVSLSVQLFTVPTIAHHLIANESAFFNLMHTFYAENVEKYVQNKVLQFAKNTANITGFKRASCILFDVRYLLHTKPDVWTDCLRKGFLHGMQILIKLLKVMQGMDAVHRQTGSHIDYEPEWESAFNLHIKLAFVISLVLEWCSTDKVVLVKVYRMVLQSLSETEFIVFPAKREVQELVDHSALCLMYDVSQKNVSIHLPLTRFFAGLYLQLEKFGLSYDTISTSSSKPPPEQIIEPVLCTQTMIAQVHAGMWRRNGYSLLNQLYFYGNVKCRSEMLDRDVIVLQIGASLIESNEFLIHIVNKFSLMNWANINYEEEDSNNVTTIINMVDEFLELLIVVIGERFVPGVGNVTEEDRIKKELIQQLCIKPYSHSELNRALPDMNHETSMENVIDEIAVFKKPQLTDKKGVYELKPEFYPEYNMYFYHYSKEEKSKSEEAQRKRQNNKNACCLPPKLPKLTETFSMIANLLQCDVMFLIVSTVLKRASDLKCGMFAESHLQKVLYLLGYGLQEEESGNYPFLTFYERAVKWQILDLLTELLKSPRVETQNSFIHWVLDKFNELKRKVDESHNMETSESTATAGSSSMVSEGLTAAEEAELKEKKRLAAERKAKIMAQMASAQKLFMDVNADLFKDAKTEDKMGDGQMEWEQSMDAEEGNQNSISCLGKNRKIVIEEDQKETCILCSEDAIVNQQSPCLVYSCFVQKSNIVYGPGKAYPHISSCGHMMHATCWLEYFQNEKSKEARRPHRNRSPGSFDIDKKEFLCPLCRCLSNCVLPLTQSIPRIYALNGGINSKESDVMEFGPWLEIMRKFARTSPTPESIQFDENVPSEALLKDMFYALSPPVGREIAVVMREYILRFLVSVANVSAPTYELQNVDTWTACMYTIQSIEMLLRATDKPLSGQLSLRQSNCLSGLIRISALLGLCMRETEPLQLLKTNLSSSLYKMGGGPISILEANIFEMFVITLFMTPATIYPPKRSSMKRDFRTAGFDSSQGGESQPIEVMLPGEAISAEGLLKCECNNLDGQCGMVSGQMMDFYNLKLAFILNMIKIVIIFEPKGKDNNEEMEVTSEQDVEMSGELPNLLTFYQNHNLYSECPKSRGISSKDLVEEVKEKSSTFLRSSCLLFHFLTGLEMPVEFSEVGGDSFELMCEYLGLSSNLESYFQCEETLQFMTSTAMHQDVINLRKAISKEQNQQMGDDMLNVDEIRQKLKAIHPAYLPVRNLVNLPDDYSDLINSVSLFTCPNNDRDDSRNPTMCLICGEILCSQTYCCQYELDRNTIGACTHHSIYCGNGAGMFLRIRECEILLSGLYKGCFVLPPYLDKYGETDQGLRRGNPLTLCRERYNKLQLLWLRHGLHEEISRSIESSSSIGSTQWQLL